MNAAFTQALAEALLPGDAHWPSGAELDLAGSIESICDLVAGHAETMDELEQALGEAFIGAARIERQSALEAIEREVPDLFGVARLAVFDAYYRHPRVLGVLAARCGYRAAPPQPMGFPVDGFDPSVLSTVRTMAKRWREDTTAEL